MAVHDEQLPIAADPPQVRFFSVGRLLILLEIYAAVAATIAMRFDVYIAPPQLIFLVLYDAAWVSFLVAVVCCAEFIWKRNVLTAIALVVAVIAMGIAWSYPAQPARYAPLNGTRRSE
jgi:hypothetical protein